MIIDVMFLHLNMFIIVMRFELYVLIDCWKAIVTGCEIWLFKKLMVLLIVGLIAWKAIGLTSCEVMF